MERLSIDGVGWQIGSLPVVFGINTVARGEGKAHQRCTELGSGELLIDAADVSSA